MMRRAALLETDSRRPVPVAQKDRRTVRRLLVTPQQTYRGRDQIRRFFHEMLEALPDAKWTATRTFAGNALLVEWTARSARYAVADGVDTFVFGDGAIHLQTVRASFTQLES